MKDESLTKVLNKFEPSKKVNHNKFIKLLIVGSSVGFLFSFISVYSFNAGNLITNKSLLEQPKSSILTEIEIQQNMTQFLDQNVRVLCIMIPITQNSLKENGKIILDTWAKRCNKFIFFTEYADIQFNKYIVLIDKNASDFQKLEKAFVYIYDNLLNDFDWILKANDNTYVVMENLKWLLYKYQNSMPLLIGQQNAAKTSIIGAYLMSKKALTEFVEKNSFKDNPCPESKLIVDKQLTKCLKKLNVTHVDSHDDEKRRMFFHKSPEEYLYPERTEELEEFPDLKHGPEFCCSDRLIAVQNIHNTHLYYYEYFIYKVHPFGRHRLPEKLPERLKLITSI